MSVTFPELCNLNNLKSGPDPLTDVPCHLVAQFAFGWGAGSAGVAPYTHYLILALDTPVYDESDAFAGVYRRGGTTVEHPAGSGCYYETVLVERHYPRGNLPYLRMYLVRSYDPDHQP